MAPCPAGRWVLALLVLTTGSVARAAEPEATTDRPSEAEARPLNRIDATHLLAARVNPLALALFSRISFQRRLYRAESAALRDNYVSLGLTPTITPALGRIGVRLELQPLSVLRLAASYEAVGYVGTFDFFQSFPGVFAEHDDETLDRLSAAEQGEDRANYATAGTRLELGALLQGKVGPLAARSDLRLVRSSMDLRAGDRTFYDPEFDILAPNDGWILSNDLDVLWVTHFGLSVGARWTVTDAVYEDRHYAPGEDTSVDPNGPTHRLGPIAAYTLWDDGGKNAFDRPTLILVVNWWLDHRYRTGAQQSAALPYAVLGFRVSGDLVPLD